MTTPANATTELTAARGQFASDSLAEPRFEFGRNWKRYSRGITESAIEQAEKSLTAWLPPERFQGATFLDVGSGSGLFSLAARRLGATVHSFDYDVHSFECTRNLRDKWRSQDPGWIVERGDILDRGYLARLSQYDLVYSYGVLMCTGDMWRALDNISRLVKPGGRLWIAMYNDQGWKSRAWWIIKRIYVSNWLGKALVCGVFIPYWVVRGFLADLVRLRNPFARYGRRSDSRAMWIVTDWLDWLGGYPFEVAGPAPVFDFFRERGFALERLKTVEGRLMNNQWLFVRNQ